MKKFRKVAGSVLFLIVFVILSSLNATAATTDTKGFSKAVQKAIQNRTKTIKISKYHIKSNDFLKLLNSSMEDVSSYVEAGDVRLKTYVTSNKEVTEVGFSYGNSSSAKNLKQRKTTLDKKVSAIVKEAKKKKGQEAQAKYVHDYIATHCHYAYSKLLKGKTTAEDYTAYGCLVKGVAVCEGYARAYQMIMKELGIPVVKVDSNEVSHEWNMIKLNGEWFHVDVCWDDPVVNEQENGYKNYVRYDYYLKLDSEFTGKSNHGTSSKWTVATYVPRYTYTRPKTPSVAKPDGLKVSVSGSKVKVSWNKNTKVKGYEVYRSTKSGSGYTCVKKITNKNTTSFTNSVSKGKTYYYKVRAYAVIGGKTRYSSYSAAKKVTVR